jgi:hypothetical protein
MIYNVSLNYTAKSRIIDILSESYAAMALYCKLYGSEVSASVANLRPRETTVA